MAPHDEGIVERIQQVLDAKFATLSERLERIRTEREHGDATLAQADVFLTDGINRNTKGLGQLSADIQKVERDLQVSLTAIRDDLRKVLKEELALMSDAQEERRRQATAPVPQLEARLKVVESKLDAVKWAAFGLSIGSGITSGGVVALLAGVLG